MATTSSAAIRIEEAHNRALEVVREHGSPENAGRVEYLDNLGGHLSSVNFPAQLSSAQSVLIGALAEIIEQQGRRIAALEASQAKPAATAKSRGSKPKPASGDKK